MTTELLEAVARVINVHCWWVRPVDTNGHQPYCVRLDEHIFLTTCRCLTLEVSHSRGCYYVGHRWQIHEYELDKVIDDMRKENPQFRYRCKRIELTPEDVQTLILRASYNVIDLDMIDDDFQPIIQ